MGTPTTALALQPSALAECRKINSGRRIPPRRAVAGAKLHRDVLVPIRNPQWRPGYRICLDGSRRSGIGASFAFPRPRLVGSLATAPAALAASVRVNPRRHSGRAGLGLVGNDEAFPL